MKKQIGQTGDNCNGQNVCYELIDHFFDRKVLLFCSWSGGSKGETTKFSMKNCENILNIFFKIVHSVNITFSRKLLEDFFKKITRNSKKRSEAKGMRQSSIHRRTKKKKPITGTFINMTINSMIIAVVYKKKNISRFN